MTWIILVSIGIAAVISIVIYLLNKSKNKFYKYIPSILFFIIFIYFFIMSRITTDWEKLGNVIYFLVALYTGILTLAVAIILDLLHRKKR